MTQVKAHERRAPSKPPEYVNLHMALMTEKQQESFARRHGLVVERSAEEQTAERKSIVALFMPWFGRRS